ncbi:CDGSH iron-sulfur domain-containing protein [bacterium]|nr:CDGSH iron-sulfur domain-containing protein [bacterium]
MSLSDKREIGGRQPVPVEVEAGQSYWWCACGRSKSQPFCDGSHKGTAFEPMEFKPEKSGRVFFCTCKATGKSPLCDGSHNNLT